MVDDDEKVDTAVLAAIEELVVEQPVVHRVKYNGITATCYEDHVTLMGIPHMNVALGMELNTVRALSIILDRLLLAVEGR